MDNQEVKSRVAGAESSKPRRRAKFRDGPPGLRRLSPGHPE